MRQSGMTLIELLVTLAIISIVSGISYNSYQGFQRETYREEGKTALVQASIWVDRSLIENNSYNIDSISLPSEFNTDNYNIILSKSKPDANHGLFKITASVKPGSRQAKDTECNSISVYQDGYKEPKICW